MSWKSFALGLIVGVAFSLVVSFVVAESEAEAYRTIHIEPVFSKMITRDKADRVYSGQITSEAGLAEFEKIYGIDVDTSQVDFGKQMLIFGITDNISSRAFQFLKQERIRVFTLDYAETGIKYKMRMPEAGKKYSYIQVFVLKKIDGIPHIRVKNSISNGLSKVYDN